MEEKQRWERRSRRRRSLRMHDAESSRSLPSPDTTAAAAASTNDDHDQNNSTNSATPRRSWQRRSFRREPKQQPPPPPPSKSSSSTDSTANSTTTRRPSLRYERRRKSSAAVGIGSIVPLQQSIVPLHEEQQQQAPMEDHHNDAAVSHLEQQLWLPVMRRETILERDISSPGAFPVQGNRPRSSVYDDDDYDDDDSSHDENSFRPSLRQSSSSIHHTRDSDDNPYYHYHHNANDNNDNNNNNNTDDPHSRLYVVEAHVVDEDEQARLLAEKRSIQHDLEQTQRQRDEIQARLLQMQSAQTIELSSSSRDEDPLRYRGGSKVWTRGWVMAAAALLLSVVVVVMATWNRRPPTTVVLTPDEDGSSAASLDTIFGGEADMDWAMEQCPALENLCRQDPDNNNNDNDSSSSNSIPDTLSVCQQCQQEFNRSLQLFRNDNNNNNTMTTTTRRMMTCQEFGNTYCRFFQPDSDCVKACRQDDECHTRMDDWANCVSGYMLFNEKDCPLWLQSSFHTNTIINVNNNIVCQDYRGATVTLDDLPRATSLQSCSAVADACLARLPDSQACQACLQNENFIQGNNDTTCDDLQEWSCRIQQACGTVCDGCQADLQRSWQCRLGHDDCPPPTDCPAPTAVHCSRDLEPPFQGCLRGLPDEGAACRACHDRALSYRQYSQTCDMYNNVFCTLFVDAVDCLEACWGCVDHMDALLRCHYRRPGTTSTTCHVDCHSQPRPALPVADCRGGGLDRCLAGSDRAWACRNCRNSVRARLTGSDCRRYDDVFCQFFGEPNCADACEGCLHALDEDLQCELDLLGGSANNVNNNDNNGQDTKCLLSCSHLLQAHDGGIHGGGGSDRPVRDNNKGCRSETEQQLSACINQLPNRDIASCFTCQQQVAEDSSPLADCPEYKALFCSVFLPGSYCSQKCGNCVAVLQDWVQCQRGFMSQNGNAAVPASSSGSGSHYTTTKQPQQCHANCTAR